MLKRFFLTTSLLSIGLLMISCNSDATPPTVVSTDPENGSTIDSSITELTVTFSEPMMEGSWSWNYVDENNFPILNGEPSYNEDRTVNILPVQLEPGKTYEIWLNSEKNVNFKDESGNSLEPYHWTFSTK